MSVLVCPVCQGAMKEVSREGILIDTCTQCRGVWLDRGELEKLAEKLGGTAPPPQPYAAPPAQAYPPPPVQPYPPHHGQPYPQAHYEHDYRRRDRDWDDDDDDRRRHGHGKPYQKSKLSRLMDFFD
jgi:hypothetical protein